MTIKEALDDIVTSGINLGAGDFVDPEALEVAASVLEKMQWISVKDRQPNNKGCYLLTVKHWFDGEPVVREAYWNGEDWLSCDDRRYKITSRVTHWMPLPEKPEEVNDDSCGKDYSHSRMEFCDFLDDAEIVDVAPVVHGRWEETDLVELQGTISETMRIPNAGLRCSVCAYAFDKKLLWKDNYCPNCGAKMDEVSG